MFFLTLDFMKMHFFYSKNCQIFSTKYFIFLMSILSKLISVKDVANLILFGEFLKTVSQTAFDIKIYSWNVQRGKFERNF